MRTLLPILLLLLAPAWAAEPAPRQTALTAKLVLKVVHASEVRAAVLKEVDALGGFPTLVTDQQLTLKVPPKKLQEVLRLVAAKGVALEKALARHDLTGSIAQQEARLRSKVDIFRRLRKLVDDSDVGATLLIEKQMSALVIEMERLRGRLRVEHERARFAVVNVSFQFRQREKLVYVHSPFDWVNSVDLGRFHANF